MNSETLKVSVITPAYNASLYLEDAIVSILNQTFSNFEYIIIDDCSTDDTFGIIQKYSELDSRIIPVQNPVNMGIAGSRNVGLSLAKGEFIAWQDADDISLRKRLEHQFEFISQHKEVGIVGGFLELFGEGYETSLRKYDANDSKLREKIFRYSPVAQPGAMLRREALEFAGKYNVKYPPAEDLDMSFRIGEKYKFANLQEVVIRYRLNSYSATFTKLKVMEINSLKIRFKYAFSNNQYSVNVGDVVYNFLQFLSMYVIPVRIRLALFKFIRSRY